MSWSHFYCMHFGIIDQWFPENNFSAWDFFLSIQIINFNFSHIAKRTPKHLLFHFLWSFIWLERSFNFVVLFRILYWLFIITSARYWPWFWFINLFTIFTAWNMLYWLEKTIIFYFNWYLWAFLFFFILLIHNDTILSHNFFLVFP